MKDKEIEELLIYLLTIYIGKNHIRMKEVMKFYRKCLVNGRKLTFEQFDQLTPYLKRDLKVDEGQCWELFVDQIHDDDHHHQLPI